MGEKLTARRVATLKAPGKYYDSEAPGLFLRIDNANRKYWIQRLTINGRRRELSLGNARYFSLKEARAWAIENKGKVIRGIDPTTQQSRRNRQMTFAEAVDNFLPIKLSELSNRKHKAQWQSSLQTYAIPQLGNRPVSQITVSEVQACLMPIWLEKNETANRVRMRIEKVLSWATVAGHRSGENPARWKDNLDQLLPSGQNIRSRQNHPALSQSATTAWWSVLKDKTSVSARALQFLTLTASRSGEVLGAVWSEVDLDSHLWIVPAQRMKMEREHRVPLSKGAISVLDSLPRISGTKLIFPSVRGGRMSDMALSKLMKDIHRRQLGIDGIGFIDPRNNRPAVPHGIRSTFRDWAAEKGIPRELAEISLSHKVGTEVERAYQRSDLLHRRRDVMTDWYYFLQSAR
jgi:integrase